MERWKKIPGFHPMYEASSEGRVRRLESTYWRMLHGKWTEQRLNACIFSLNTFNQKGYRDVRFAGKLYRIHRIIALAFIPNPENLPQVNHKNAIKTDNRPENLEWVTNQENRNHIVALGLHCRGSKAGRARLKEIDIPKIRLLLKEHTQAHVASLYKVSQGCIQQIADGHNWKHIK